MKKKLIFYSFIIIFACNIVSALAQGKEEICAFFTRANELYKQAQYDQAVSVYESLIKQGIKSGNLYYNLANSYVKQHKLGKAVLNYERAKLIMPNDSDLKFNYAYCRSLLEPQAGLVSGNWFLRRIDRISAGLNVDTAAAALSLLYILFLLSIAIRILFNGRKRYLKLLPYFLIGLFTLLAVCFYRKAGYIEKTAVVVSQETQARFEPLDSATVYFTLPEGALVEVLEKRDREWYKIRRADGKLGWVPMPDIEKVEPSRIEQ